MSRSKLACFLIILLVGLGTILTAQPAPAVDTDDRSRERVNFDTFDTVELRGTFYPSAKNNKAACVLLLHDMGASSEKEGWDGLARALQRNGYAVLSFDFRGHGDSTAISESFWLHPINRTLKSYRSARSRDRLEHKDFNTLYHYGMLVNDIAAAKRFLDRKNDSGECNSSNLILIGDGMGATLGALWISTEFFNHRLVQHSPFVVTRAPESEGDDIACAVWLSMSSTLASWRVPVDTWLRAPVRDKVPIYFIYGEDNARDAAFARWATGNILQAERLKWTGKRGIPNTKLSGRELLGIKSFGTEELIVSYLDKVLDDRGQNVWTKSNVETTPFVPVPFERFLR